MDLYKKRKITAFFLATSRAHLFWIFIAVLVMIPSIYILVLSTGGIKYVYSHTMYIPIIIAAAFFGYKGGIITGVIAGLLLGPLMPLETITFEMQDPINWIYRLTMFVLVGGFIGFVLELVKKQYHRITVTCTKHHETRLPSYHHYMTKYDENEVVDYRAMITVIINNYEDIVILLGREMYVQLVQDVYDKLYTLLGNPDIIQIDYYKFWIDMDLSTFRAKTNELLEYFESDIFIKQQVPMFVDISLGICTLEKPTKSRIEGFRASEMAALHAKNHKMRYCMYEEAHSHPSMHLKLLAALPLAIKHNQLFLEYHPQIDLKTNEVIGVETLVRWRHEKQRIAPLDFIPIAEETKLIDQVTDWIVRKVIEDYPELTRHQELRVNVNVSQRNLSNPDLISKIIARINKEKALNLTIGIEMTESTLMANLETTKTLLASLKANKITTSIDDFGTGYSTLSTLSDLAVETIKIDRHLVAKLETDKNAGTLIKMIIDYAHTLDIKVVAEGIETKKVLDILKEYGCDSAQGFYYTIPLPLDDVVQWMIDHKKDINKLIIK